MFFENLETERLILQNIGNDDRDFVFSMFSSDIVNKYLFDAEPLTDISGADEIINFYLEPEPRNQHRWIIINKINKIKMGTCGFHCWDKNSGNVDIGYDLKEEFWGNGYMQEAINEIIKFAVNKMDIIYINACIFIDNQKSINLVHKLNFIKNGSKNEIFRGKGYLHNIYTLQVDKR
jgi:ribosomal-protein-alanine N-acetyltransferase